LEKHGIDPKACAMVGDREIDVASGIAAGTDGILFDEFRNLPETAAQHRVYTVAQLRALLLA
jgi:phosphoglycolate phosphatase-like HAD superfamily hydrolase